MTEEVAALKRIRKTYRIPRSRISIFLDTTEVSVRRWERGETVPSPIFQKRLRAFVKVFTETMEGEIQETSVNIGGPE